MPFGIDDVLGVIPLCLVLFQGCIKALTILSKAEGYQKDTSCVRLQIRIARHCLFTWAEEAGLTQEPPTLLVAANKLTLVSEILDELCTLLTDLDKLEKRYGLRLRETSENVETFDDEDTKLIPNKKQKEYTSKVDAAVFLKKTTPWKKLRWITLDDKKVAQLLEKVKSFTDSLKDLLEESKQVRRNREIELFIRSAVLSSETLRELDVFGLETNAAPAATAIAAAARLKRTMIQHKVLNSPILSNFEDFFPIRRNSRSGPSTAHRRSHSSQSVSYDASNTMKLRMSKLTLESKARTRVRRAITLYDGKTVLLEWKYVETLNSKAIENRVNQVANLLHELDPCLHSLSCQGYVKDHDAKRYGYIFNLPEVHCSTRKVGLSKRSSIDLPDMISLRKMFDRREASKPSLNERLTIATTLLDALLNLHTAGWLHKELRSDNIVLIQRDEAPQDKANLTNYSIYIAGYVFSRVDRPGEVTEPLPADADSDLYRHPLLLNDTRPSFCKGFDLFSVGCTMIEIGLWMSLTSLFKEHVQAPEQRISKVSSAMSERTLVEERNIQSSANDQIPTDSKEISGRLDLMELRHALLTVYLKQENQKEKAEESMLIKSSIMQSLQAATGKRYTRIVEELLLAKNTIKNLDDNDMNEQEFALDLEVRARDAVQAILDAV